MKLVYRGVSYEYSSMIIDTIETEELGKFLGNDYQVRRPIYQPNQVKLNLVYHGIAYNNDNSKPIKTKPIFITKLKQQLEI
jgi:hypothetical protein